MQCSTTEEETKINHDQEMYQFFIHIPHANPNLKDNNRITKRTQHKTSTHNESNNKQ